MLRAVLVSPHPEWRLFLSKILERDYLVQSFAPNNMQYILDLPTLPDLIVLDTDVDDICDMALLQWFLDKNQFQMSQLIVIANSPSYLQQQCAVRAGATAFLTKPFTYQEFRMALGQLVT